ncbi:MAG: hypothetical protein PHF86_12475 [Candidatus Nanoarchaeia archaeon]|nr:hypothetical protein [Candidatus Nanoarchaeia archaeon]
MKNNWSCKKRDPTRKNGMEYECTSRKGKEISIFNDGSIRFSKDMDGSAVKVNNKIIKYDGEDAYGVEIE